MCLFCQIAGGELAASIVYEDEETVAFLDHRPVFIGHTLVVPRAHADTLLDLSDRLVEPFFTAVRTLARAVQTAMEADGSFVGMNNVVSQSVPHLHAHVVPRKRKDGLRGFFWPRTTYESDEHREQVAAAIRAAVER
jgi:histidine triad (HIT) family protein